MSGSRNVEGTVTSETIGIVGLGKIGGAVAQHLLKAGYVVTGWARRPEALGEFIAQGGRAASSLSDLGQSSVVISIVFDDAATREVALGPSGLAASLAHDAVHVAMETISPRLSRELADEHAARRQLYLAAPVFGRPDAAARGELAIMCSGAEAAYRRVAPLLSTAGTTRWVGPEPEQAMLVKLIGNHVILSLGELLGETFDFLRAGGVSGAETKAALFDDLMPRILAGYVERVAAQPDAPRPANSAIGKKDNALALAAAQALGVDLPLARLLREDIIDKR